MANSEKSNVILSGVKPLETIKTRANLSISKDVTVTWSWYDETQGIVSWNFKNNSSQQKSVILFRNGYYFGNAFWCVYVNNGMTYWATTPLTPLTDNGVQNNTMPIAIINFNGKKIIAFVFTLAPGQQWSVLEGGFSAVMPPSGQVVYEVTLKQSGSYCIGYDEQQVIDWDLQTGTTMQGYQPNPATVNTVEFDAPSDAEYVQLFPNDTVNNGSCPSGSNCLQMIEQGISNGDIEQVISGLLCLLDTGAIDIKKFAKHIMMDILDKL